ncbi:MAG: hypothetical protein HYV09_27095 [Deltaproteobacteria bacterium]|nr:hypothetical protein [Deltaproteobacteria bacterium]
MSLYRAVLAHVRGRGDAAQQHLSASRALTGSARSVLERRAKGYRFSFDALASAGKNPTIYPFRYLRQAHAQCFWVRREEQVAWILENDEAPPFEKMPSCQD